MATLGEMGAGVLSGAGKLLRKTVNPYYDSEDPANVGPMQYETMDPRKQYWKGVGADVTNVMMGGKPGNLGHGAAGAAEQFNREGPQRHADRMYKEQIARAQLLNAQRPPTAPTKSAAEKMLLSEGLVPKTPEWNKRMQEYMSKSGQTINLGNDFKTELATNIWETHGEAQGAADQMSDLNAMEELIPSLGKTGIGKESMTNIRSTLNQFGLDGAAGALDGMFELFGADAFSGEQGAAELFKALSAGDILAQLQNVTLTPVSDKDIQFLRDMAVTLQMSDTNAMKTMINRKRGRLQRPIDKYNAQRKQLGTEIDMPDIEMQNLDVSEITSDEGWSIER